MSHYATITPELASRLAVAVDGRLLTGEAISEDYARDETPGGVCARPEAVALPHSAEEVAALLRLCREAHIPVTPRGAGTGLAGGAVPVKGGLVISLAEMDRILEFREEDLSVRVQPGVLLSTLQAECERRGLFYPPDPGEKMATLGGNLSTNAGGMRAVKYGVSRDYLRGAQVALPSGELLRLGADVAKNSSGYALLQLLAGSEGTLGIFTELTLRLLPLPQEEACLLLPYPTLEEALRAIPTLLSAGQPRSLEFMDADLIRLCHSYLGDTPLPEEEGVGACLLLCYDGGSWEELDAVVRRAGDLAAETGALDALLADTPSACRNLHSARDSFLPAIKAGAAVREEIDAVLPISQLAAFLPAACSLCREKGVTPLSFGHAGDGNVHFYLCDCPEETARALLPQLFAMVHELGGLPSGEHGIGCARREALAAALDPTAAALMRGIKAVFDPEGILNPGKIL